MIMEVLNLGCCLSLSHWRLSNPGPQGFNSEDVTKQLSELGMTPAEVVQRIMAEPELAQAFSKPQVTDHISFSPVYLHSHGSPELQTVGPSNTGGRGKWGVSVSM